ncbi:hypothetical protein JVT61DRAFT_4534 [Boletus reticuloceps]|uniref:XLF-like N-terminal domain-containing protein n=1 Tax=Boletus reticuloceps TaxID=495285 RepID=A0A8I3A7E6_9AGAM|nr:hypothetical protein JVT61DRAFT_4534 [Boletus reticuloceps]
MSTTAHSHLALSQNTVACSFDTAISFSRILGIEHRKAEIFVKDGRLEHRQSQWWPLGEGTLAIRDLVFAVHDRDISNSDPSLLIVSLMDAFNEENLLAKEWLVKVDPHTSTPYLFKFHFSPVDLTCCIMITDTKRTWAEVLSSKQFARRWRECNRRIDSPSLDDDQEEAWRTRCLELLSSAHTLGGMLQLSFEVVEVQFWGILLSRLTFNLTTDVRLCKDFALQLECDAFKWRWETIFVGHKVSADILSKHLIMPLISANHLAFSSPVVVGDLPPTDLEKAIDKIARIARRTVDTHVKNALSKPRLATTMRRITAVFNFISDPPNISTEVDSPVLLPPPEPTPKIKKPELLKTTRTLTPEPNRESGAIPRRPSPINHSDDSGSATEPEDDTSIHPPRPGPGSGATGADQRLDIRMRSPTPSREDASPRARGARNRSTKALPSDTDSSPVRPIKKSKPRAPSSDEDSEAERKKLADQIKRGTASAPGLRQPIKRGGKRF